MRYFVLKNDSQCSDMPYITNLHQKIDVRNISLKRSALLEKRTVLRISPNKHTIFPDVIVKPILLMSKEVWKVIKLYNPYLNYKHIILLDSPNELMKVYHLPILEKVDCLSDKALFNKDHSVLYNIVLNKKDIEDKNIFIIDKITTQYIVVRMDLVESLFFRECTGICLEEIVIDD